MQEGVSSTIESFSHLAKDSPLAHYSDLNEQSKVEKLPGSGKEGVSSTVESFSYLAKDSPLAHYIDLNEQFKSGKAARRWERAEDYVVISLLVFTWLCWVANLVTQYQHDRNIKTVPELLPHLQPTFYCWSQLLFLDMAFYHQTYPTSNYVVMLHLFCSTLDFYFVKCWAYTVLKWIQVVLALYLLKLILLQSSLTCRDSYSSGLLFHNILCSQAIRIITRWPRKAHS
ncbi:hypothetical protein Patl1_26466 [Pistacia atlantica]|uniref:Uncharacterized protein n=1 Tax=Pistacia atlantica TaxID=434234 RepID=A0ACC1B280_9ROSI|nr:hypothetical protein Patl1_26466 [Pistacia atlantica]